LFTIAQLANRKGTVNLHHRSAMQRLRFMLLAGNHDPLVTWLMDHEALAAWTTALATLLLAAGVFVAWFALRDDKKTRHAQLITELSRRMNGPAVTEARRLANDYGRDNLGELAARLFGADAPQPPDPQNVADWEKLNQFSNLLEMIGVLVRDGALPPRMVFQMWGIMIISAGAQWEAATTVLTDKIDPTIYRYFVWLVAAMKREQAKDRDAILRRHPKEAWFG
jgi:hypothetical protein